MNFENISKSLQVISVVVGVVVSVLSFNGAREKDIQARMVEAETRRIEALAPFYQLRQERYVEISKVTAILSDQPLYDESEIVEAKKRFRALYISELSMVESGKVESSMAALAAFISPDLLSFSDSQRATYNLSHALADSFTYDK